MTERTGSAGSVDDGLRDGLIALSRIPFGTQSLTEVLRRMAELAVAAVPGADEVSITLLDAQDRAQTVAFSGDLATVLDERQYADGYGPCLDAAQSGETIRIDDTARSEHYPEFAATARRVGVHSTVAIGMPLPYEGLAALNVYTRTPGRPLDEAALTAVRSFADHAAVSIANAALLSSRDRVAEQLTTAMRTRAVIEQAKGVVATMCACDPEEAFEFLRKRSQSLNRKLHDIAAQVVDDAVHGRVSPFTAPARPAPEASAD
ncbi:ANTAR domain-containing protein [Kineococcus sp. R8]|uniref:GAF and ANTAR domain-containing protein n=1 Tax=Kineococcus siccus TaxID=2696567 RepID=UPI0014126F4F|nr:GAF and ANTAR domain-containing protein [Kineococcus siccus]NAZ84033.1 ANTAR domain-containing protein [Kineococcus siccus]